jgi:hypothetical protein
VVHDDAVPPAQRHFLEALRGRGALRGFYLAEASNLALRFGHRQSLDHDFFRESPFSPLEIHAEIVRALGSVDVLAMEKGTLTVRAGDVKASFLEYPYPMLEPVEELAGLFPSAGFLDLALMKLAAIADRGARLPE